MATNVEHGKESSIYVKTGTNTYTKILNGTSWALNVLQELTEARVFDQEWIQRKRGLKDFNISIEGLAAATVGAGYLTQLMIGTPSENAPGTAFFRLFQGSGGTVPAYEGSCLFSDFNLSSSADGLPTYSANVVGAGGAIRRVSATPA